MSQIKTNTTDLQAILAQVNALPDAGSSSGESVLETGTLTTVTSFISTSQDYYADLESIPDITSKHLVVLRYTSSSRDNPSWVLTRNSLDDEFSVSAVSGDQGFNIGYSLTGYIFSIYESLDVVGELTYYAI